MNGGGTPETVGLLDLLNRDLAASAARVRGAVVQVLGEGGDGHGGGAGVHLGGGLVVTCAHCVRKREPPVVRLADGRRLRPRRVACDDGLDLAALHVEVAGLPALRLAERPARVGEAVLAVGHPWGSLGAASAGVVVGTRGYGHPAFRGRGWLVVDAHLRPGHSGGPLVDARGDVAGIAAVVAAPDLGGAVPAEAVRRFLGQLEAARRAA
jgi:serine protease Do